MDQAAAENSSLAILLIQWTHYQAIKGVFARFLSLSKTSSAKRELCCWGPQSLSISRLRRRAHYGPLEQTLRPSFKVRQVITNAYVITLASDEERNVSDIRQ